MRRGFTLIELMIVAGIMAFLGTAATGAYTAFQRGMAERGATGVASSLFKAAKERALVDRSPTIVFCYNRLIREASDDENAIAVGEAVAIRRAGRVTYVSGSSIVDEFADVLGSYDVVDKNRIEDRGGIRLWKFGDTESECKKGEYSIIADAVKPLFDDVRLYTYEGWSFGEDNSYGLDPNIDFSRTNPDSNKGQARVVTRSGQMHSLVYAFHDLGTGSIGASEWKVGNGYGFEFARVQLPHNFVFEGTIPTQVDRIERVKVMYFNPESATDDTIDVYRTMPDASGLPKRGSKAGQATSKGNTKI